jgi:hypothetical protein
MLKGCSHSILGRSFPCHVDVLSVSRTSEFNPGWHDANLRFRGFSPTENYNIYNVPEADFWDVGRTSPIIPLYVQLNSLLCQTWPTISDTVTSKMVLRGRSFIF